MPAYPPGKLENVSLLPALDYPPIEIMIPAGGLQCRNEDHRDVQARRASNEIPHKWIGQRREIAIPSLSAEHSVQLPINPVARRQRQSAVQTNHADIERLDGFFLGGPGRERQGQALAMHYIDHLNASDGKAAFIWQGYSVEPVKMIHGSHQGL